MAGWGRGGGERGATALTVAIVLGMIGAFVALVINVGHLMAVRSQLQNAVDAAALAGAEELDGTPEGIERARAWAVDFAARHGTDRDMPVTIDPWTDVVFGDWDLRDRVFTPIPASDPGAAGRINAVQVLAGRAEARGNPLEVFFSGFLGGSRTASVGAEAIAVSGAPCEEGCSVPLVFAECIVKQEDVLQCDQELVFSNDTEDNVGFTNLLDGVRSVNTADIIKTLGGECRSVRVGDRIGVSNGNNLNKNVIKAFEDFIARNGAKVTVPIVATPDGCPAKFNQMHEVVGFATFTIKQLVGPPNQSIHIELDCGETVPEPVPVGCGYFGTTSPRPGLVR
jgi:hypothetical protein